MSDKQQMTTSAATGALGTSERDPQRAVPPAVDVFELKVEDNALLIEGGVQPHAPDGLEPVYAELRVPRYRRSFTLSRELDATRIEASLKDGVLTLRIPKQAHAQPRRIAVTAG